VGYRRSVSDTTSASRTVLVTGAPGSGKSTACNAFVELGSEYVAFDIDWLTIPASELAGRDIIWDRSTWPAYGHVWFEVLHGVTRNHRVPVFFTSHDRRDIEQIGGMDWCRGVEWLLLDCDDPTRASRLQTRPGWTDAMIEDAIRDARYLRATIEPCLDTTDLFPEAVAEWILGWLNQTGAQRPATSE
jgi:hypothetical protein